jgi:hypothetical protein
LSRQINIDNLEIRLKGISRESARAAADNLGRDLLGELARSSHITRATQSVDQLDAGTVRVASAAAPATVRSSIVAGIAASIKSANNDV